MGSTGRFGILTLLISSFVLKGATKSCTNPFFAVGDQCLFFGNGVHQTQEEAKELCTVLGGRLLQIDTAQEFQTLVEYINNDSVLLQVPYWLDGSDQANETIWLYSSGDEVPFGTPFWATWTTFQDYEDDEYYDEDKYYEEDEYYEDDNSQIDNNEYDGNAQYPTYDISRNCVGLTPDEFFYLMDADCEEERRPICEELEAVSKIPRASTIRCDQLPDLTDPTGTIHSPSWPETYPANTDCDWYINVGEGNIIRLSFSSFDTEYLNDYLVIEDSTGILGLHSGPNHVIPDILSNTQEMELYFYTDASVQGAGFEIHWRSEPGNISCVEEYVSSEGQLYSPGFPEEYPKNLDCQYTITTDGDKIIRLTTSFFETEYGSDYLVVYDGGDSSTPLLMNLTGTPHNVPEITSTGNQLFLTFQTDEYFTASGFDMSWKSELACPLPFISIGGMCLKFLFSDLTFGQATVSCNGEGGSLASIHTAEQLRDFFLYVNQIGIADGDYWLGGSDLDSEDIWTWKDGTFVPMGTPFWGNLGYNITIQEPDGGTNENCLALTSSGRYFFRDQDCERQIKAVCMYQI